MCLPFLADTVIFYFAGLDHYVLRTSQIEKDAIDEQVGRYVYATNTPFSAVTHPEFIKLVQMLRPGYCPPSRYEVAGSLLDKVQQSLQDECKERLEGKTVSMCLDGWSNIHNEPVVCVSVTTSDGDSYLTETVDTSGHSHTAEYMKQVASSAIKHCEEQFKCNIGSIVTDNAANMRKMREELKKDHKDIIAHGCSAHLMNLLAHDIEIKGVKEHVTQIVKYFRNTHLPAAWYKAEGGKRLVLPQDVRWNTLADCLQCYLDNWSIILKVCEENRDSIDTNVASKVQNIGIKRQAEDYLRLLKPISIALDIVQSDSCFLSDAVSVWKKLEKDFEEGGVSLSIMKKFHERCKQALTPAHYLAYILDPRTAGKGLSTKETDSVMEYVSVSSPDMIPIIMNYRARADPFKDYLFSSSVLESVSPFAWWKSLSDRVSDHVLNMIYAILGATASSAGVERIFSTFGFVHSKVRNRLGTEKAGKLVFVYKLLNK